MSTFELEKKIHSCEIDIELIKRLEEYIKNSIPKIVIIKNIDAFNKNYSVEIEDINGTEKFKSITEYPFALLHNNTKKITIRTNGYSDSINISLIFRNDWNPKIKIELTHDNARDLVLSIHEGLKRIIDTKSNNNRFYHSSYILEGVLFGIAVIFLSGIGLLFTPNLKILGVISLTCFIMLIIYSLIGHIFKPNIVFSSQKSQNRQKVFRWFLGGVFTFIIFGTLFVFLRRKLLGF